MKIASSTTEEFTIQISNLSSNNILILTNYGNVFSKDLITQEDSHWMKLNMPNFEKFEKQENE